MGFEEFENNSAQRYQHENRYSLQIVDENAMMENLTSEANEKKD